MERHTPAIRSATAVPVLIPGMHEPDNHDDPLSLALKAMRDAWFDSADWDDQRFALFLADPLVIHAVQVARSHLSEDVRSKPWQSTDDALVLVALVIQAEDVRLPAMWNGMLLLLGHGRHQAVRAAMRHLLKTLSLAHGPLLTRIIVDVSSGCFPSFDPDCMGSALGTLIAVGESPSLTPECHPVIEATREQMSIMLGGIRADWAVKMHEDLISQYPDPKRYQKLNALGTIRLPGDGDASGSPSNLQLVSPETVMRIVDGLLAGEPASTIITSSSRVLMNGARDQIHSEILARRWTVLDLSPLKMMAGTKYVGELEKRLTKLRSLSQSPHRIIISTPDVHQLISLGAHKGQPHGMLELMAEDITHGRIRLLGACLASDLPQLRAKKPEVYGLFNHVALTSPSEDSTIQALAQSQGVPQAVLREFWHLANKFRALSDPLDVATSALAAYHRLARDSGQQADLVIDAFCQATGVEKGFIVKPAIARPDHFESSLAQHVLGQPAAIKSVASLLDRAHAGLTDESRPLGVLLFTGPTGTGKTYMAHCISRVFFGSDQPPVIIDMSEFNHGSDAQRLLLDEGQANSLCRKVNDRPCSVLLLDEVEKAHPAVLKLFLQVFESGCLTTLLGVTVDFRNTIIVMTSNLGVSRSYRSIPGFAADDLASTSVYQCTAPEDLPLPPEFLNRIDAIVPFEELSVEACRRILTIEMRRVFARGPLAALADQIVVDAEVEALLIERGFDPRYGARSLKRTIDTLVVTPLARALNMRLINRESGQIRLITSQEESVLVVLDGHQQREVA